MGGDKSTVWMSSLHLSLTLALKRLLLTPAFAPPAQLQGRIARAFSSNSLVNTMDTWAYWCIILPKRAGIEKIYHRMFRTKYLLGCLGKLREVSSQQYVTE